MGKFYGNKYEITGKWEIIEKKLGNNWENSTSRLMYKLVLLAKVVEETVQTNGHLWNGYTYEN